MNSLLTPNEVARLLHLSVRTVYAQSHRLGGFYPAGIRVLRFRREDIYAIMEGPQDRQLEIPVPHLGQRHSKTGFETKAEARPMVAKQGAQPHAWPPSTPLGRRLRFGLRAL